MVQPNPLARRYLGADELTGWRLKLYVVIFEADTAAGKTFDVGLILVILEASRWSCSRASRASV